MHLPALREQHPARRRKRCVRHARGQVAQALTTPVKSHARSGAVADLLWQMRRQAVCNTASLILYQAAKSLQGNGAVVPAGLMTRVAASR